MKLFLPSTRLPGLLALMALLACLLGHTGARAQAATPFVRLAVLEIDPLQLDAFKVAARRHAEAALRDEPGLLALHAAGEKSNPGRIHVFEMYADAAAYEAHLRTPHFQQFLAAIGPMTTSRQLFDTVPVLLGAKAVLASSPVVRTAELTIDPAQLTAYTAAVYEEIEASIRVEPGVLAIYAVALKDTPNRLRFFELYADENAYQLHRESPHFRKYLAVTQSMITARQLVEADPIMVRAKPPAAAAAPAYYLSEFELTDAEGIRPYSAAVESTFTPFGGRYVVRGGQRVSLEGEAPERVIMIMFPSLAQAQGWYDSPAYKAIRPIRQRSATARVFVLEGMTP
jgi:quinol monooxygenase YgiN/uncharacterized protein (DUF1330 family)